MLIINYYYSYWVVQIIHVPDAFWNGHYPFIDHSTDDSIDRMFEPLKPILPKSRTTRSSSQGIVRLWTTRNLLSTATWRLPAATRQRLSKGKADPWMKSSLPSLPARAWDDKWRWGFMSLRMFTALVFEDV